MNVKSQTTTNDSLAALEQKSIEDEADRTFSTSHSISINGVPFPREGRGFHQTVRPDFDMQLRQVIGDNVRSIIDINEKNSASLTNSASSTHVNINDINLLGAGSEQKPKSRIVTKKGENGKEYEYEYYYYYEDDSDVDDEDSVDTNADKAKETNSQNAEVVSGNAAISLGNETPLYSRATINEKTKENDAVGQLENFESSKKNSIRRPSLDLVDSQSFNTNDKKSNPANKTFETQQSNVKDTDDITIKTTSEYEEGEVTSSRPLAINSETTAFIMQKSALDLYAMLANENLNSENEVYTENTITTTDKVDAAVDVTSDVPISSTSTQIISSTESVVTLSETEHASTSKPSLLSLRTRNRSSALLSGKRKETSTEAVTQPSTTEKHTTRRRFNAQSSSKNFEGNSKKEDKTEGSGKNYGSSYNRFNLKTPITRTTEEPKTENISTTTRNLSLNRRRPGFNNRQGVQKSSTASVVATESNASTSETTTEETQKLNPATSNKLNRINNIKNRRNPLLSRKRDENKQAEGATENKENQTEPPQNSESTASKLKQRGRLNLNVAEKPTASAIVTNNRRVNPLLRSRSTTTEPSTTELNEPSASKDIEATGESDISSDEEVKTDTTSEAPTTKASGLAALRRKILLRQPGKKE